MKPSMPAAVLLACLLTAAPALAGPRVQPDEKAAEGNSNIDSNRLQDTLELQRLKALYFYHVDHKNWDAWRALFTEDAVFMVDRDDEQGKHTLVTEGMDNIMEYVKKGLAVAPSIHQGYTPLYAFQSATEASGIWAMSDIVHYSDSRVLYGYGHYHEQYRKEDGAWKFATVHLTRLKVEIVSKVK